MSDKDEIRSQILRDGETFLLLPNAVVLEIVRVSDLEKHPSAPHWVMGVMDWQDQKIPLVSMAGMLEQTHGNEGHKAVVIKTLNENADLECYAIHSDTFPQFVSIYRQGVLIDASHNHLAKGVSMAVLVGDKSALIPDLDAIEQMLMTWWSSRQP